MKIYRLHIIMAVVISLCLGVVTFSCSRPVPPPQAESGPSAEADDNDGIPLRRPDADMETHADHLEIMTP